MDHVVGQGNHFLNNLSGAARVANPRKCRAASVITNQPSGLMGRRLPGDPLRGEFSDRNVRHDLPRTVSDRVS